jgi:hypothetical protein
VLPLLRLVEEGSPVAANCLALLHEVSQYEQAKVAFLEKEALTVLRNYRPTAETASWVVELCRRLGIQQVPFGF